MGSSDLSQSDLAEIEELLLVLRHDAESARMRLQKCFREGQEAAGEAAALVWMHQIREIEIFERAKHLADVNDLHDNDQPKLSPVSSHSEATEPD